MTELDAAINVLNKNGYVKDITRDIYYKGNTIISVSSLISSPSGCMGFAGLYNEFKDELNESPNWRWDDQFHITQPTIKKETSCYHEWLKYTGLNEVFYFCKKCDEKKKNA